MKSCFQAPPGWLYVGIDFNALEDTINMLLTGDPNKLKIKLQGFDGQVAYRCYHFWPEKFPQLDPEDPKSINSSKILMMMLVVLPRFNDFALQVLGTWANLAMNCASAQMKLRALRNVTNQSLQYHMTG